MPAGLQPPTVRRARLDGPDAAAVTRLVGDYLGQTEREKARHLGGTAHPAHGLPAVYGPELRDPAAAYAGAAVYLAEIDGEPVGVAILNRVGPLLEIKRLWADPAARGRGVGGALLDTVVAAGPGVVRLSVWDWREAAIKLYASRGFRVVESWDGRGRLLCMERHGQVRLR